MKTGIVFEGGANRTVFSVGVMDALMERGISTDYLNGSSAGIAYGINLASKQKGRVLKLMENYVADKRYMGPRHMFNRKNKSYFNLDFIYREIPNKLLPFDFEEYKKYPSIPEAAVTNVITGKTEYLPVSPEDKDFMVLRASCALPLIFPIIHIQEVPYMDGGLSDPVPVKRAFEMGCEKVIVVLTRERGYKKGQEGFGNILKMRYGAYPEMLKVLDNRPEIYNDQRKEIFQMEEEGKIFLISPESTKGFSRIEKNITVLYDLYHDGFSKMKSRMRELEEYLEKE